MANDTTRTTISPAIAAANGASPQEAAQANSPQSKMGKEVVSASGALVKGNNHLGTANVVPTAPKQVPSEAGIPIPGNVTDEQRARQQAKYTESDLVDPTLQMTLDGVKQDPTFSRLGGLGATVQNYISKQITDMYNEKINLTSEGVTDITEAPTELTSEQKTAFDKTLNSITSLGSKTKISKAEYDEKVKANEDVSGFYTDEMQAASVGELAKIIGTTDENGQVSVNWDTVKSTIGDVGDVVGKIIATGLSDSVKIDDQILTELGYDTASEKDELSKLLNVADVSQLTVKQLQDKTSEYLSNRFAPIEKLRATIDDPFASASEREAALENLRDLGYKGTLASEQILSEVHQDIMSADKNIEFAGKVYANLDEMLSDSNITGLVRNYLDDPTNTKLPDALTAVIDKNRDAFEDITSELKTAVTEFNDVQDSWKKAAEGLSPDMQSILGYDPKTPYYTTKFTPPTKGLLGKIFDEKTSAEDKIVYKNVAENVTKAIGTTYAKTVFDGLDASELKDLAKPEIQAAFTSGLELGKVVDDIQADASINMEDRTWTGKSNVLSRLFGVDSGKLLDTIQNLEDMEALGDKTAAGLLATVEKYFTPDVTVGQVLSSFDVLLDAGNLGKVKDLNALPQLLKDTITGSANLAGPNRAVADFVRGKADVATTLQALTDSKVSTDEFYKLVKVLPPNRLEEIRPALGGIVQAQVIKAATEANPILPKQLSEFSAKSSNQLPPETGKAVYDAMHSVLATMQTIPAEFRTMAAPKLLELTSSLFNQTSGDNYKVAIQSVNNPSWATEFSKAFDGKIPTEYAKLFTPTGGVVIDPRMQPSSNEALWQDLGGVWLRYVKMAGASASVGEFANMLKTHKALGGSSYSPGAAKAIQTPEGGLAPNVQTAAVSSGSKQSGPEAPRARETETSGLTSSFI